MLQLLVLVCLAAPPLPALALSPSSRSLLTRIEGLAEGSNRGVDASANAEIVAAIDQLRASYTPSPASVDLVEGEWELLWTTERETLFLSRAGLLGNRCLSVRQSISRDSLRNSILFDRDASFEVEGDVSREGIRSYFKFRRATLRLPPLVRLPLPPVGKGWFDTVYVDRNLRVSFDVRGDYLVCRRVG